MIDRLHHQHEGLYSSFLELRNRISNEQCFDFIANEVKPKLSHWIAAAQRHRDRERRLLVSAFNTTFGARVDPI